MPRLTRTFAHGTDAEYTNHRCRCAPCTAAHAAYHKEYLAHRRAEFLAAGLNTLGKPRKTPYNRASLRLLERFGLEPDPRFLREPSS